MWRGDEWRGYAYCNARKLGAVRKNEFTFLSLRLGDRNLSQTRTIRHSSNTAFEELHDIPFYYESVKREEREKREREQGREKR